MPHVSKKIILGKAREEIINDLFDACIKLPIQQRTKVFSELLTETEKTMLSKRLGVIIMLEAGARWDEIGTSLGMSPSTIARLQNATEKGRHKAIVAFAKNKRWSKSFWATVERIMGMGLPSRGHNRWDWLNRM